jgi:heterodisulfide reductase subunit B
MTRFLYYPGCSMTTSAHAYASSLAAISAPLDIELVEVDDWNCCGAMEYVSVGPLQAHALVARNLALAERQRNGTSTLVAPCSACFVNLARTDRYVRESPILATKVNAALAAGGLQYTPGSVTVRHLVEVILDEIGVDEIARHVTRPLTGLRVAPYLGCLVTRPDYDGRWSRHEHPREYDRLLAALGAEVVDFPLRTDCCGGHMTQISPDTAFELIRRLVHAAQAASADVMATVCPMCQMNIDAYQGEMNHHFGTSYRMPVLFFTQLVALAFGASGTEAGIGSELVSVRDALHRIGIDVPAAPEPVLLPGKAEVGDEVVPGEAAEATPVGAGTARPGRRTKRPTGLPMPRELDER